jgi:hypothetical protein
MRQAPRSARRLFAWLIALTACGAPAARASHLVMDLTVEGRPQAAHAGADTSPPAIGKNVRPRVQVRAGDSVKLRWSVKNADARRKLDRLLVHLFIVREAEAGQKEVPDPRKGALWESVFATALEPSKGTSGEVEVPVDQPGTYLVRVESMLSERNPPPAPARAKASPPPRPRAGSAKSGDPGTGIGGFGHEHFAAVDLVVE